MAPCLLAGILLSSALATSASSTTPSNSTLLQKAREQYQHAQQLEATLNGKEPEARSRSEYLKVITAYQRVYLITPRTGYADNALVAVAKLYEAIRDTKDASKTLTFLIHEYPSTPFMKAAKSDLARLESASDNKPADKAAVANPSGASSVDNIRYWEAPNSVRVVVDLSADAPFKQGEAKSPDRVFIDIAPARLNTALIGKQWPVQSGLLQQIRVGQFDNSTVRVVLDVGTMDRVTSFTLHDPDRLVIDVIGGGSAGIPGEYATPAPSARAVAAVTTPDPPATPLLAKSSPSASKTSKTPAIEAKTSAAASAKTVEISPAVAAATDSKAANAVASAVNDDDKIVTPAKPTNRGDQSLIRSLGLKLQRVVIDPGHGGHDTGTIGPGGYTEKELVLDIAQRLKVLIEASLGAEVVMTRNDDTFIPLETRTAIANQHQADLFISIHANSSPVRTVRGVETFFLNFTTSREATSREALDTASRENAAAGLAIHELQDIVKKIMLHDKVDESRELAERIQKAMVARKNSGTDRGVKQAPFVVLIGANMPSILTEVGFISNPQEEKLLRTPECRQLIAESIFEGVRSYSDTLSGLRTAKVQEKK